MVTDTYRPATVPSTPHACPHRIPHHAAGTTVSPILQMRRPRPERWYNLLSDTQLVRVGLNPVGSVVGSHPLVELSWVPSICQVQPKSGDKGPMESPPVTSKDSPRMQQPPLHLTHVTPCRVSPNPSPPFTQWLLTESWLSARRGTGPGSTANQDHKSPHLMQPAQGEWGTGLGQLK